MHVPQVDSYSTSLVVTQSVGTEGTVSPVTAVRKQPVQSVIPAHYQTQQLCLCIQVGMFPGQPIL